MSCSDRLDFLSTAGELRRHGLLAVVLMLNACASMHQTSCGGAQQPVVHDSLYFGAAKLGGTVTAEEWDGFLSGTVTPRFPQGLTVWQASGQWRSADGAILKEASQVIDLVHPDDESSERAVLEIVAAYKSRFQQEAVLRVKADACASF